MIESFLHTHPFMIASWTEGTAPGLFLLVSPKNGFTRKLLQYARPYSEDSADSDYRIAWFSGPHGRPMDLGQYGSVIMFATGLGIAAQLPHLKDLIKGYSNASVRTRRTTHMANWRMWSVFFARFPCRYQAKQESK